MHIFQASFYRNRRTVYGTHYIFASTKVRPKTTRGYVESHMIYGIRKHMSTCSGRLMRARFQTSLG
jgi:hypothetical protein